MNNKVVILILSILFVVSSTASVIGIIEHNKDDEPEKPVEKKKDITYEYYLEDTLVEKMPNKETDDEGNEVYRFSKYQCDNNVTGKFNEEDWTFKPDEIKAATCKIYFVKTFYDVDITVSNAKADENNPTKIEREGDGVFYIIPNDGYEFASVTCANNKEVKYDEATNKLTINAISEDVACKVDFELKTLKADLTCKNCKDSDAEKKSLIYPTERKSFGDNVEWIVTPNAEFKLKDEKKLTCTNNQKATFDEKNNKLIIEKLTSDTACTIEFEKQIIKHKFTLELENLDVINGTLEREILNKDGVDIIVKPKEGFEIKKTDNEKSITCNGSDKTIVKPTTIINNEDEKTITYKFESIVTDIKCKITATEVEEVVDTTQTVDTSEE